MIEALSPDDDSLFWEVSRISDHHHVSCVDRERRHRGSGFHQTLSEAKKRAFVELNERCFVQQLMADETHKQAWALDFDASASGFAAGYDMEQTKRRALLESVERWALSKWVDEGYALPETELDRSGGVSDEIRSLFIHASLFHLNLPILVGLELLDVHIAVFLGWQTNGVFAGYGTKTSRREACEHAHVEAYRNFMIWKNQPPRQIFPYNRIRYFAEHRAAAEATLSRPAIHTWNSPVLKMFKVESFGSLYLARAILDGWVPWQHGSETRFLY